MNKKQSITNEYITDQKDNSLPRILKIYKSADFATQEKVRFIYYLNISMIFLLFFIVVFTTYNQMSFNGHKNIHFPFFYIETILIILFTIYLLILIKGYYKIASNLLIISSNIGIWYVMWVDKGQSIVRLDTVVFIVALFNMLPLLISKFKFSFFIYIIINIILLIMFILIEGDEMNLTKFEKYDFVTDTGIAILFSGIIGYNNFNINKKILIKTNQEIAERIKTENALKESELLSRRVFDSSKIPIIIMDSVSLQFIDFNSAAKEIYQFSSNEQTKEKTPFTVSPLKQSDGTLSKEKFQFYIDKVMPSGSIVFEWQHQHNNGDLWDAEIHLMSFISAEKTLLQFSVIDITERKKAENDLRKSEEKYRYLMQNINEVVMMVDNDDRVLFVNEKFTEKLGYSYDEIIGKIGYEILLSPEDQNIIIEENKNRLNKINNQYEIRFGAKDGSKIDFLLSGAPMIDAQGNTFGSIGTMIDITEKKKIEIELDKYRNDLENLVHERTEQLYATNEELQAFNEDLFYQKEELQTAIDALNNAQNQIIKSEKLASLGVLSARIAHEINNPLNFINGGILGIEDYIKDNLKDHLEYLQPLIDAINEGVSRSSDIVSSLSHYSVQDDMPRTCCEIHSIINNCLVLLQSELKNKVEIIKQYNCFPVNINCNEGMLHQAIFNILSNSMHSIESHGTITILTDIADNELIISISDTGIGMSKSVMEKIFDPFFTTKEQGKGTGLGLSITYKIIQEHNGTLSYQSEIGHGTTATIKLPIIN